MKIATSAVSLRVKAPEYCDGVAVDLVIMGHQNEVFVRCLSDEHSVERIAMDDAAHGTE